MDPPDYQKKIVALVAANATKKESLRTQSIHIVSTNNQNDTKILRDSFHISYSNSTESSFTAEGVSHD